MPGLKMLCVVRRRSGMTRREFLDYHFQQHGAKSEGPTDGETPLKYFQTHFFDAAYPEAPAGKNSNYPWAFLDDMTELYFSDPDHMRTTFTSDHVKTVVGPDGVSFNDFAAANAMLAAEDVVVFGDDTSLDLDTQVVANYFVQARDIPEAGAEFLHKICPILTDCVQNYGGGQVSKIVATTSIPDQEGILKYFGGEAESPEYTVVFTLYLKSVESVSVVRKIQSTFETAAGDQLNISNQFITFGKRALLFDQTRGIKFDLSRQPAFGDL